MKQNIRTKWFALTLTAALALTTLTACGNGSRHGIPPRDPRHQRPPPGRERRRGPAPSC